MYNPHPMIHLHSHPGIRNGHLLIIFIHLPLLVPHALGRPILRLHDLVLDHKVAIHLRHPVTYTLPLWVQPQFTLNSTVQDLLHCALVKALIVL